MQYPQHPQKNLRRGQWRRLRRQRGMSLVEWMISITIGMILLAGLTALIARQSSTQAELEKSSRQIENGRYAMHLLNEDIQVAGYYGEFSDVKSLLIPGTNPVCSMEDLNKGTVCVRVVPGTLPNPCLTAVADLDPASPAGTPLAFPVQGYDSPASTTGLLSCINAANHVAGTDILVLRRVEPATLTVASAASAAAGQVYLQSGLTPSGLEFERKMGAGSDATTVFTLTEKNGTTLSSLRKFLVHIYFVSPCSVMANTSTCTSSDDGGNPVPTLKRLELSAAGNMTMTPLVEGIENMQIDYGIDTTDDGAPDGQFVSKPAAVADWANLVALRVHLLARNNEATAGYSDPKTYAMGYDSTASAQVITPAAGVRSYKRRLFSQLIRLINPSSRRDS